MTKRAVNKPTLDRIEALLIEHVSPSEVVRIAARQLGKSPRTIRRYISQVYKRWEKESPLSREYRREEQSEELSILYEMATGKRAYEITQIVKVKDDDGNETVDAFKFEIVHTDINAALKVAALMSKLHGLDAPTEIKHSGEVKVPLDIDHISDENADRLREIIASARPSTEE